MRTELRIAAVRASDEMRHVHDALVTLELALRSAPDDPDELASLRGALVQAELRLEAARSALDAAAGAEG